MQWIADILRCYNSLTKGAFQYQPFHKQLCKLSFPKFIRKLLEIVLEKLSLEVLEPVPEGKLMMFKDIVIHDGSSFAIKASLKKSFPGRFKKNSPAAVELHVTMSGLSNDPLLITLAPDKESEKHFRPDPKMFKDCLLLGDRAFQDRKYFMDINSTGGFFIIRGTKNIKPIIRKAYDTKGNRLKFLEGKKIESSEITSIFSRS